MFIPIYKPELPPYDVVEPEIKDMYSSGMLYPDKYTERLETQVKQYSKVGYARAVSSCSVGLILLLNTLLASKGKVIIPSFTFNATLQALEWNNFTPVVVDVDINGQMPPYLVEEALLEHPDTLAVLPVHMWGNACYPHEYEILKCQRNIPVFFDGAHVFGTTYLGYSLAKFGTATVHSIAATKPVSAGEGGLVLTDDEQTDWLVFTGASHGLVGSLDTKIKGINGKIQEFNSILAYHAIKRLTETKKRRAEIMGRYRTELSDLPVRMWKTCDNVDAVYKDCVLFTENTGVRERLEGFLNSKEIGTKRYFDPAIPDMGSFKGVVHSADMGRKLANTCLTIPLYPSLRDAEVDYIIDSVKGFFES